jgi:uncharacterized coiled-coil DUF342 family protein
MEVTVKQLTDEEIESKMAPSDEALKQIVGWLTPKHLENHPTTEVGTAFFKKLVEEVLYLREDYYSATKEMFAYEDAYEAQKADIEGYKKSIAALEKRITELSWQAENDRQSLAEVNRLDRW